MAEAARAKAAVGLLRRGEIIRGGVPHGRPMEVGLDGGKLNVRGEGWKEFRVGTVFEIAEDLLPDPVTEELQPQAHAVQNTYVAVLGELPMFGQRLWAEAVRREFPEASETVAVGDGAPWIWNLVGEHFGTSRQVVDWYHAKAHLYQARNLLYGKGSAEAHRWVKGMETPFYQGHAERMAEQLKELAKRHRRAAKGLRQAVGYFHTNQRRMQYLEIREDGFPIGSGMVESGIKQFRTRFTGPGMRWSRVGRRAIAPGPRSHSQPSIRRRLAGHLSLAAKLNC